MLVACRLPAGVGGGVKASAFEPRRVQHISNGQGEVAVHAVCTLSARQGLCPVLESWRPAQYRGWLLCLQPAEAVCPLADLCTSTPGSQGALTEQSCMQALCSPWSTVLVHSNCHQKAFPIHLLGCTVCIALWTLQNVFVHITCCVERSAAHPTTRKLGSTSHRDLHLANPALPCCLKQ